jgi:hypothetical protein
MSSSSSPERKDEGASAAQTDWTVTHCGRVGFENGKYVRLGGSANWRVQAIPGFGQEIGPPLGQIRIVFLEPVPEPYVVLVTPIWTTGAPLLGANCGELDQTGFVVHLFDPVTTRTLQNGSFSWLVLTA